MYIFGTGTNRKMYISSADFMTRNMTRRVEVALPVYDENIRNTIFGMFEQMLKDNVNARVQVQDGNYEMRISRGKKINSQLGLR